MAGTRRAFRPSGPPTDELPVFAAPDSTDDATARAVIDLALRAGIARLGKYAGDVSRLVMVTDPKTYVNNMLGLTNVATLDKFGPAATVLTAEVLAKLRERLRTPPDGGGVWTSKKVAAFMAGELGRSVSGQRGWEALRAIEWTLQRPRPQHAEAATPEEQAAFKKTSPRRSPRKRSVIPARRSRSSPPTSTASG